eukprot:CAMPEP_0183769708 /NCGR_PEP_ID=MMETSP0739-20130205/22841_1 /TAXON_ID=385413 /ORGANISM="Thalassiosira miniscula, Strain CCMP1093" /LENGTH=152 /DNA_ID=CAMNT_0026009393 /DNA_START=40 /DNA_END=498 /DNA_ORIENTATION=+
MAPTHSHSRKHQVRFSECSLLYSYPSDHTYDKSYTTSEKRLLEKNAFKDALRIKAALLSGPIVKSSSLSEILETRGIEKEEILGIEDLVLEDPIRIMRRRRACVRSILRKQACLKEMHIDTYTHSDRLAEFSVLLTGSHVQEARSRAKYLET